jgi:hypothetical protein
LKLYKKYLFALLLLGLSATIALLAAEICIRILFFGGSPIGAFLRYPSFYADPYSDDDAYRLQYWLARGAKYSWYPDRLLGWVKPTISPGSYKHAEESDIGNRRPVLLYGDSWAECLAPRAECFGTMFNQNQRVRDKFYLLNYGVGSYGIDQIFLLYKATVQRFDDPLIIFSFLDQDLDRAALSAREWPKPFFVLTEKGLELRGTPVEPDWKLYFDTHPPEIWSYLYRLAIYPQNSPVPERVKAFLRGDRAKIRHKEQLSRAILLAAHEDMKKRGLRHVFLVFEETFKVWQSGSQFVGGGPRPTANWHRPFLEKLFADYDIPHIWASKVVEQHTEKGSYDWRKFVLNPRDNHPNYLYNRLIAERLVQWVLTDTAPTKSSSASSK